MLVEGGYTFNASGPSPVSSHDYPETLLRVGALANWFEFRVGQNFLTQKRNLFGVTTTATGAQDLYLGVKFALTEQKRFVPEIAVIPQMTVPTGSSSATAGRTLPGVNVDGTWEIARNRYGVEFVIGNNVVSDDPQHSHFELDTGFTNVFQVTRKLEAFAEWDAFYPNRPRVTRSRRPALRRRRGGFICDRQRRRRFSCRSRIERSGKQVPDRHRIRFPPLKAVAVSN
jgi:Putative MetA-pathway of phenol degradation